MILSFPIARINLLSKETCESMLLLFKNGIEFYSIYSKLLRTRYLFPPIGKPGTLPTIVIVFLFRSE